ncbi:transcriptional regulator [Salmonella enterica]|uniref:Transcriptional regulator n=1 Tax=Salmonella enterica TaxID=28901 RepID=A0A5T2WM93_SALER|nr:transcriptional regulator [Salmonella enterica]EAV4234113.1 transcriptional regulator [Salmonella enterica]
MAESQPGLFADDPGLNTRIDQLDSVQEAEIKRQWPRALAGLVDIFEREFCRQGMNEPEARRLARNAVVAQAGYMGGRSWYLPTGETLFAALRHHEIFTRWHGGEDIEALRCEYRLSQTQIYAIIREQRQLHVRRIQPPLFL